MAANSAGGRVATLPLNFASNAFALSSVPAIDASMAGSVREANRSVRSQRIDSAPVVFVACAMGRSGYRLKRARFDEALRVRYRGHLFQTQSRHAQQRLELC